MDSPSVQRGGDRDEEYRAWRDQQARRMVREKEMEEIGKKARNVDIRNRLQEKQRSGVLTFASPTADHNYKHVFLCQSPAIREDFCNARGFVKGT
ncbi:MAG: hypothetical protein LBC30_00965 [Puniceicoccales bacterium]|jgi:hypothetical protein|nr:hypothetical protein [Puniceicoccales bacterium]